MILVKDESEFNKKSCACVILLGDIIGWCQKWICAWSRFGYGGEVIKSVTKSVRSWLDERIEIELLVYEKGSIVTQQVNVGMRVGMNIMVK